MSEEPRSSEEISQSKKTRSVTFRLDSSVIDELQTEADNREISLNVLINQVLKRYSEWDRFENKIGMMPVPKVKSHYDQNLYQTKTWMIESIIS